MIKFDLHELIFVFIYTFLFSVLLLIYGLTFAQAISLGIILAQFYQVLVKIHHRIRR